MSEKDKLVLLVSLAGVVRRKPATEEERENVRSILPEALRDLLEAGLVSEEQLCKRFVITPAGLAKWKSGEYVPSSAAAHRIFQVVSEEVHKNIPAA